MLKTTNLKQTKKFLSNTKTFRNTKKHSKIVPSNTWLPSHTSTQKYGSLNNPLSCKSYSSLAKKTLPAFEASIYCQAKSRLSQRVVWSHPPETASFSRVSHSVRSLFTPKFQPTKLNPPALYRTNESLLSKSTTLTLSPSFSTFKLQKGVRANPLLVATNQPRFLIGFEFGSAVRSLVSLNENNLFNQTPQKDPKQLFFSASKSAPNSNPALDLYNTGIFYQASHQYHASQSYFEQAISLLEKRAPSEALGQCYQQMSKVLQAQKLGKVAVEYLKKSIQVYNQISSQNSIGCYQSLGQIQFDMGNVDESLTSFHKALDVFNKFASQHGSKDHNLTATEADLFYALGRCYILKNDQKMAVHWLNQAVEKYQELNDRKGVADTYYYIGCSVKDDLEFAADAFKKSLAIRKQIYGVEHHTAIADCYRKLGNLYTKKSEFGTALDYYFGAVNSEKVLAEASPKRAEFHKHRKAVCYYKLGVLKEHANDQKNAEHYFLKALRAFPNPQQYRYPDVLLKLSAFYRASGRLHEAEEYRGRAIDWYTNHHQEEKAEQVRSGTMEQSELNDDFEFSQFGAPSYLL